MSGKIHQTRKIVLIAATLSLMFFLFFCLSFFKDQAQFSAVSSDDSSINLTDDSSRDTFGAGPSDYREQLSEAIKESVSFRISFWKLIATDNLATLQTPCLGSFFIRPPPSDNLA